MDFNIKCLCKRKREGVEELLIVSSGGFRWRQPFKGVSFPHTRNFDDMDTPLIRRRL